MTTYGPPSQASNTGPYAAPPPPHVQVQEPLSHPSPPRQREPYQPTASHNPAYPPHQQQQLPPQQQQQAFPYGAPAAAQQQYFPAPPPNQMTPNQLHPAEAYNNPYDNDGSSGGGGDARPYRPRSSSNASATSRRSHRSTHSRRSSSSQRSHQSYTGRKPGERATLGDSLFGIWGSLRAMIPAGKR